MAGAARLSLDRLTRRFRDKLAVDALSLEIASGELVALMGASGSGKTTTLRMVAGYEPPDSGKVWLEGKDITNRAPRVRGFGMVFQHYALLPHMTVWQNGAFGLGARGDVDREVRLRACVERHLLRQCKTDDPIGRWRHTRGHRVTGDRERGLRTGARAAQRNDITGDRRGMVVIEAARISNPMLPNAEGALGAELDGGGRRATVLDR